MFFTYQLFDEWKARVIRLLRRKHSRIHAIVDAGCLPIFSLKSNRWFGIRASLHYERYRVPQGTPRHLRRRQALFDLLESNNPMRLRKRYTLCDASGGVFLITSLSVVMDNPFPVREMGDDALIALREQQVPVHTVLYLQNLYPRLGPEWMRGGDLLHAAGIIFALSNVRFLVLGEGPDVQRFEQRAHGERQGYKYYDKFVLSTPQRAYYDLNDWVHYDADYHLVRKEQDDANFWVWDKV